MKKEIKLLDTKTHYFADDEGKIYRLDDDEQFIEVRQLTLNSGYKVVYLRGCPTNILVHRCVYNAFIDNTFNVRSDDRKFVIDHKDGNRTNNRPDNLQLISASENIRKSSICHETEITITNIETNKTYNFNTYRDASKAMQIIEPKMKWCPAAIYQASKDNKLMCKKTYKIEVKKKINSNRSTSKISKYHLVNDKGNILKVFLKLDDILEQCELDSDIKSRYLLGLRIKSNTYVNHDKKTKIIKIITNGDN